MGNHTTPNQSQQNSFRPPQKMGGNTPPSPMAGGQGGMNPHSLMGGHQAPQQMPMMGHPGVAMNTPPPMHPMYAPSPQGAGGFAPPPQKPDMMKLMNMPGALWKPPPMKPGGGNLTPLPSGGFQSGPFHSFFPKTGGF